MLKRISDKALEYENYLIHLIIPIFLFILNTVGISGAALFVPFFALVFPALAFSLTPGQGVMLGLITESFGISSSTFAFMRFGAERIRAFAEELASKKSLTVTHKHKATPENVTLTDRNGKVYNYCLCAYRIRLFGYTLGGIFQEVDINDKIQMRCLQCFRI